MAAKITVTKFLATLDEKKRKECKTIMAMMRKASGKPAKMWTHDQIGFGSYHYVYESGHEGDWFLVGLSPRKQNFSVYIMPGFSKYKSELKKLGDHKLGKSCLYLRNLDKVDLKVLEKIITDSVKVMKKKYKVK